MSEPTLQDLENQDTEETCPRCHDTGYIRFMAAANPGDTQVVPTVATCPCKLTPAYQVQCELDEIDEEINQLRIEKRKLEDREEVLLLQREQISARMPHSTIAFDGESQPSIPDEDDPV